MAYQLVTSNPWPNTPNGQHTDKRAKSRREARWAILGIGWSLLCIFDQFTFHFIFIVLFFCVCVCAVLGWGRVCVRRRHHPGHRRLPRAQSNLGQQQYQLWQRGHCLSGPLRSCNLQGLDQYYVRRNGHQAGGYLKQEEDYHWNTCNKNLGSFFPFIFLDNIWRRMTERLHIQI